MIQCFKVGSYIFPAPSGREHATAITNPKNYGVPTVTSNAAIQLRSLHLAVEALLIERELVRYELEARGGVASRERIENALKVYEGYRFTNPRRAKVGCTHTRGFIYHDDELITCKECGAQL